MLESVGAGGERWARYSVVGVGCRARVTGAWDGDGLALSIAAAPGFTLPAGVPAESRGLAAITALLAAFRCARGARPPALLGRPVRGVGPRHGPRVRGQSAPRPG
jgi:hypothetical protein